MNEEQWLACERPWEMVDWLILLRADPDQVGASYPLAPCPEDVSDRQLRLFARAAAHPACGLCLAASRLQLYTPPEAAAPACGALAALTPLLWFIGI